MNVQEAIINTVLSHYPAVQAIYLFGSYGTDGQWPNSDIDVALLLPPEESQKAGNLALSTCRFELEATLHTDVDLVNLRTASTVFQKEVIGGWQVYSSDRVAVEEFEMLVISYYQKLNEERKEILASFGETGRAYNV